MDRKHLFFQYIWIVRRGLTLSRDISSLNIIQADQKNVLSVSIIEITGLYIVVIEDGKMVNPYLKKRSKGKRIVSENPLYKKDVMSSSTVNSKNTTNPAPIQNASDSVTNRFSKELGQHGYLKHTAKQAPQNYAPSEKMMPEGQYDNTEYSAAQDEPYRREAGKVSLGGQNSSFRNEMPPPSSNHFQNYTNDKPSLQNEREMGSRGINRRLVEENIIRNASAERGFDNDTSKMYKPKPDNNASFQHRHNDSLDDRIQKYYDDRGQNQTLGEDRGYDQMTQNNEEVAYQDQLSKSKSFCQELDFKVLICVGQEEDRQQVDANQAQQHDDYYIEQFYHPKGPSGADNATQKPSFQPHSGVPETFNNINSSIQSNTVKFQPPQVSQSMSIQQNPAQDMME
jgi:hypothetical protein